MKLKNMINNVREKLNNWGKENLPSIMTYEFSPKQATVLGLDILQVIGTFTGITTPAFAEDSTTVDYNKVITKENSFTDSRITREEYNCQGNTLYFYNKSPKLESTIKYTYDYNGDQINSIQEFTKEDQTHNEYGLIERDKWSDTILRIIKFDDDKNGSYDRVLKFEEKWIACQPYMFKYVDGDFETPADGVWDEITTKPIKW